jgi:very-short-patch-repair endonuclease
LLNNPNDFGIAQDNCWYRIPLKNAPAIIKESTARLIAFYHTKEFLKDKFTIQWFAEIKKISIVKREKLFPRELINSKTGQEYYKVEFHPLRKLIIPIVSLRPRRILFIPTTEEKFFGSKEINFLFNGSTLENKFWNAMMLKNIYPERQYFVTVSDKNFFLDFALFCKSRNIDIEIDGDHYHMNENSVRNDKQRNNLLESKGWSVLRFTNKDLDESLDSSINIVLETANRYGGIQDIKDPKKFNYLDEGSSQMKIFNE